MWDVRCEMWCDGNVWAGECSMLTCCWMNCVLDNNNRWVIPNGIFDHNETGLVRSSLRRMKKRQEASTFRGYRKSGKHHTPKNTYKLSIQYMQFIKITSKTWGFWSTKSTKVYKCIGGTWHCWWTHTRKLVGLVSKYSTMHLKEWNFFDPQIETHHDWEKHW